MRRRGRMVEVQPLRDIMKRIALIALAVAVPASARTLGEFCGSLYSPADRIACVAAAEGRHIPPDVLELCAGMYSPADKIECVRASARGARSPRRSDPRAPSCSERVRFAIEECRRAHAGSAAALSCVEKRFR